MWEEENEPVIFSPTPPRPRRSQSPTPPPPSPPPPPPAATGTADAPTPATETALFLHETFSDIDDGTVGAPPTQQPPAAGGNGHDPYGFDPEDFETPRLAPAPAATGGPDFETLALSEFDPAEVDIRDFTGEPPAVTVAPIDDESLPPPAAASGDRTPAGAEGAEGSPTIPQPRDPDGVSENRDE